MEKIIIILVCMVSFSSFSFADEIDDLIPFIIKVESNGNPNAVSNRGAIGLMQITPIVLKEYNNWRGNGKHIKIDQTLYYRGCYNLGDLYNPPISVEIGTWYLRRLKNYYLRENYTIERLLHAWNGGITKLRKYNYDCSKMPRESRNFSKKVMRLYNGN